VKSEEKNPKTVRAQVIFKGETFQADRSASWSLAGQKQNG